jgi:hypothetical protein
VERTSNVSRDYLYEQTETLMNGGIPDSKEQIDEFRDDPEAFDKYCRGLEGELNKRFTLMHLRSKDQLASKELVAGIMADVIRLTSYAPHLRTLTYGFRNCNMTLASQRP